MSKGNSDNDEELKKDIDFDFFEDDKSEKSSSRLTENNLVKDKDDTIVDTSKSNKKSPINGDTNKSSKSLSNSTTPSESSSSLSSSLSKLSTKPTDALSESSVNKTNDDDNASLTEVSSDEDLESDYNLKSSSRHNTRTSGRSGESTANSHIRVYSRQKRGGSFVIKEKDVDDDDDDKISSEVILGAMLRIYEGRCNLRTMRPKWVEPNTKDYSTSRLTSKVGLIPDKLSSKRRVKSAHNIRANPFYLSGVVAKRQSEQTRMYHTAINRTKEQERIEKENIAMFSRLKQIRPTPGITKNELIRDYSRKLRFNNNNTCNMSGTQKPQFSSSRPRSTITTHSNKSSQRPLSGVQKSGYDKNDNNSLIYSSSRCSTRQSHQNHSSARMSRLK